MSLDQEQVEQMAHDIDGFLYEIALNNDITMSAVSGMVLARLMRMCEDTDDLDNFYKLLNTVSTRRHESESRFLQ
jgi:hypothetical protein